MTGPVVVIGAGTNGLVAALALSKAGRRVIVLDQQQPADSDHDAGWLPPIVQRLLGGGFGIEQVEPWLTVPLEGGGALELSWSMPRSIEAIRRLSPRDASRWAEFSARMRRLSAVLETLYQQPAPDVETSDPRELLSLALLGLKVRGLGKQAVIDLLRILPMSVTELLDEWFESAPLKAAIGATGVMDLCQGPRSAGTAFVMLHHHVGRPAGVFRPQRASLRGVLGRRPGLEIRHEAAVHIGAGPEGVRGVTLDNDEVIETDCVVSALDPRRTLLELLDPGWLDPEFMRAIGNIKMRGIAGQVSFGVDQAPAGGALCLAPSLTAIERAYDDVKYGRISAEPWIELRTAPHRVDATVQYLPQVPRDGAWDDARKRALGELTIERVRAALPAIGAVSDVRVTTPLDLEAQGGLSGGHRYQGDLTLDQILFMRPVPGWSRYRTPVRGLWLCGAGTHPGGGVAGASGLLAAREIRKDGA